MPITTQSVSDVFGTYDGHQIHIEKEDIGFYIIVEDRRETGMRFDGFWGTNDNTFAEAWAEALRGSCIKRKKAT